MNIDILEISELKWTRMGEFNSHDHYIYHGGQKSLRINRVTFLDNNRVQTCISKMIDLCSFPRQTIQYHSNPSLCSNH